MGTSYFEEMMKIVKTPEPVRAIDDSKFSGMVFPDTDDKTAEGVKAYLEDCNKVV